MSSLGNILLDKEILLESGTNELEILVFTLADYTFGINVAKVREVLPWQKITNLPKAHPSICGVFKLRDRVIPCVSLSRHLGIESRNEDSNSSIILTDFNQQQTAFVVDSVDRIYRLSWENILAVPGLDALSKTPVTALARHENRLIVMLDFEMMLDSVTSQFFRTDAIDNPMALPRETIRILLAEDSPTVREAIGQTLRNSGYEQIRFFENGGKAWQWIEANFSERGCLEDVGDIVISDVEMPQIDGFHLTKRIKQHPELAKLPVLLYSSIVTPDNHKKGQMVGADAQVAKPELARVVELVDELISKYQQSCRATEFETIAKAADMDGAGPSSEKTESSEKAELSEELELKKNPQDTAVESCGPKPAAKAPSGVNLSLWSTFRRELLDHTMHLSELFDRARTGSDDDDLAKDILRTLHTVKSASMVVPIDPITRCTHLAEDVAEAAQSNLDLWKSEGLDKFMVWLEELTNASTDIDVALNDTDRLESLLSDSVA